MILRAEKLVRVGKRARENFTKRRNHEIYSSQTSNKSRSVSTLVEARENLVESNH